MVGIVSFGYYFPKFRIKTGENTEKTAGAIDEDTVTMAVTAGIDCLEKNNINRTGIKAIYVGSESHPYAVKPTASLVGQFLGINDFSYGSDFEFACKAGTSALIAIEGLIKAGKIKYGLVVGADRAQGKKGDALEKTCACGAACFLLGDKKKEIIAKIVDSLSFQTDTPDFWRRDGELTPSHAGRFSGEPAYFYHIKKSVNEILRRNKLKIKDFDQVIFHQPNDKFPVMIAKELGVSDAQFRRGYYVKQFGNSYSANSLLGLCRVLETSKPGELILVVSYGSGAGSDAIIFQTTKNIIKFQKGKKFGELLGEKTYLK